MIRDDTI